MKWLIRAFCLLSVLGLPNLVLAESLFDEASFRPLTSDKKAYRVGDNLTVLIVEVSKAGASSDSKVNQSLEASGSFGQTNRTEVGSLELGLGRNSGASTQREGELRARVSVDVIDKDDVGRLLISGEQKITVNGEKQTIKLTGWVREEDITAQNTILSTRISDAQIEYNGKGILGDSDDRGFIHWFLTKVGLI
ncbi:flagellar basal body L-ring protein FlgH [Hahella aquimaris]|uniref:flagellar basal body L-ring protein FlgH n=1 Tax=Hahella sp. HNIBRBA332 TaxID=3015983 RepID=UPI00273BD911|nr:flagellar basal body L-ring protein FlgH [Hahella sp. HNIBRBA332]WLQ15699.1 flagellar basal body L-ring protein FlgH [Hahella sp. HNIBRBA332]